MGGVHFHPMMVLERWKVAAIVGVGLGLGLVSTAIVPAQTSAKPKAHRSKTAQADVVQPEQGAPLEQAVRPDASAPLQQTPNYDPPPPPPLPPEPVPPPPAQTPAVQTPMPQASAPAAAVAAEAAKTEPPPPPSRPMTAAEQQLAKDSTLLLKLVRELKDEVEKAGTNTLSLSALRKADEILKLSKSLKERAKGQTQVIPTKGQ